MSLSAWQVNSDVLDDIMTRERLSSAELARRTGLSVTLVRNMRNGAYLRTRQETLEIIAAALQVRPTEIARRVISR